MKWLKSLQFSQVFTYHRGPSFPLIWLVADFLNLKLITMATLFNTISIAYFISASFKLKPTIAAWLSGTSLLLFSSAALLSYHTAYLTESILLGAMLIVFAEIFNLQKIYEKIKTNQFVSISPIPYIKFYLAALFLYGLKFWLLLIPLGFLFFHYLFFILDRENQSKKFRQNYFKRLVPMTFVLIGSFALIHRPHSNTNNISATLIRFNAHQYILAKAKVESEPLLKNQYLRIGRELSQKIEKCQSMNIDRLGCLTNDPHLKLYFKTAYLSQPADLFTIFKHALQGWYFNIAHASSLSDMYYGPHPRLGHFFFRKIFKGLILLCFYLMLIFLPFFTYKAISPKQNKKNKQDQLGLYRLAFILGFLSIGLNLFLSFTSSNEQGRVELPGMILFYYYCAFQLYFTLIFFSSLKKYLSSKKESSYVVKNI